MVTHGDMTPEREFLFGVSHGFVVSVNLIKLVAWSLGHVQSMIVSVR